MAWAGPPFVTDDPEPVDYQHWELYVASMQSELGGDWSGTLPHIELNYGALPDLQLHLIAPMAYDLPPQGAAHYGPGDLELGAKYRFVHETNGWPQIGTFPLVQDHLLFSAGRSIDGHIGFQCYIAWQFTFERSVTHLWSGTTPGCAF